MCRCSDMFDGMFVCVVDGWEAKSEGRKVLQVRESTRTKKACALDEGNRVTEWLKERGMV